MTPHSGGHQSSGRITAATPGAGVGVRSKGYGVRLIVQDSILFHRIGQAATAPVNKRLEIKVNTQDEEPYQRPMKVGGAWTPLDLGWMAGKAGVVHIYNDGGEFRQKIPTPEEREAVERLFVQLGIEEQLVNDMEAVTPFAKIPPRESNRNRYDRPDLIRLRCPTGEASITITVFPE